MQLNRLINIFIYNFHPISDQYHKNKNMHKERKNFNKNAYKKEI